MIYRRVTAKNQKGKSLELVGLQPIESDRLSTSELIANSLSDLSQINVVTRIKDKDGDSYEVENILEVPRMSDGMFIINGGYRMCSNRMDASSTCRLYKSSWNALRFCFDWNTYVRFIPYTQGSIPSTIDECSQCLLHFVDLDYNEYEVELTDENCEKYKDFLELTDDQLWRIQIRLDKKLDSPYITRDLVAELYASKDDRYDDSIVSKQISTFERDFKSHMYNPNTIKKVITGINSKFLNTGKVFLKDLQTAIKSYFSSAKSSFIEIPSNVNPIVYDSLKSKIKLQDYVSYNKSFADIIDPANTPENANANIINELNVCITIIENDIFIDCYDLETGAKLRLNYFDYLNRSVLRSEYYDYANKSVIKSDSYGYKLRCKDRVTTDLSEIELVEPSPDERLSPSTRRIPFVNMCDTVRIAMGDAMNRQSIETAGSEPRLVGSGNDEIDVNSSIIVTKYDGDSTGKVIKIDEESVSIIDELGIIHRYEIPNPIIGANDSMISFTIIPEVGDKVKPNQILMTPYTMKSGTYGTGINARAVYLNYLGYSHEDGIIVSESYAKKCTSYNYLYSSFVLKSNDVLESLLPLGSKIGLNTEIARYTRVLEISQDLSEALDNDKDATNTLKPRNKQNVVKSPNNVEHGYLVDVRIEKVGECSSDVTNDLISKYYSQPNYLDSMELPERYKSVKVPNEEVVVKPGDAYIVRYLIIRCNKMKIGDKSSNSYGSKGEIALILPDELMPQINPENEDGTGGIPADIIMNPDAVTSRKNISQLYEVNLNRCIESCYECCLNLVESNVQSNISVAKEFTKELFGDRFTRMTDEEFCDKVRGGILNFRMEVGSFSKITYEKLMEWMKFYNVDESDPVFLPDVVIYEDETGTKACSPEYAKEHGIKGKLHELGWCENNPISGYSYMYKMYHSGDYSGKVTSAISTKEPLLGRGKRRDSGQKIGEMEYWALTGYGTTEMLNQARKDIVINQNSFISNLMLAGFLITDDRGIPMLSDYRRKVKDLEQKYSD